MWPRSCALARPTVGLITNAGAEHLEGFGSLEGVARAEGEMVAALAPAGDRRHQCRRCVRAAVARPHPAHASSPSACAAQRISAPARCVPRSERRASHTHFRLTAPQGSGRDRAAPGRRAQRRQRARRRRRRGQRRRHPRAHRAGPRRGARRAPAGCSSSAPRAALAHRRFLQRQSELGARRRSRCCASLDGRKLAGARRHGRARRVRPQAAYRDRRVRTRRRHRAAVRDRRTDGARGRELRRRRALVRRHRGAHAPRCSAALARPAASCACSSRARAVNRLERVVEALTGSGRGRRGRALMLYWLTQQFGGRVAGAHLHVFSYLTLRAILAAVSALGLSLLIGPHDDRAPVALPDRPGGARRRAGERTCRRPAPRPWAAR